MNATERFKELQRKALALHGVKAESRFIDLATPRMRAHVLERAAVSRSCCFTEVTERLSIGHQ
jgi:hypothetical protein